MNRSMFLKSLVVLCSAISAAAVSAQTNAIQIFGQPADVRPSTQGTSYSNENAFNTTILDLTCPSPVQAKISSTADGTGNVLVDNFISFNAATDICSKGTSENGGQQNCFTSSYANQAMSGGLNGQDPTAYVATGGVPPIDVSGLLQPGSVQAQINLVDTGGYLTSSTLYLVTNCSSNGVAGPGQVTGNPISSSNPNTQQLAQGFSFNANPNQQVQFGYDLTQAQSAGTLSISDGTAPSTGDTPLNPANFQTTYLHGTSFATSSCLLHTGELYNNAPACKLFTLTCQVGTNPNQSGALCPVSQARNEIFSEVFDGPSFSLPDIAGSDGLTFHQGVGLLEATETWGGGSCTFDSASTIHSELCPQNLLTSFSGPGAYKSGGRGQSSNSDFVTVYPVPEDLTQVNVTGQRPGYWINSRSATVNFMSTPPALSSQNQFVAAPIASLTYGVSQTANVPPPDPPLATDTVLNNSSPCPAPGGNNQTSASVFTPSPQVIDFEADGQYLVHYLAQDCAGTEELKFTQAGGNWSTSFYTYAINVDTVYPKVASGPFLSPAPATNNGMANSYYVGQKVTATYSCSDDRSGVVQCGASTYAPGSTLTTPNLSSAVDTSKPGTQTFTVIAVDAAGNQTTASVQYQVAALPAVNLDILKLAPLTAKQNGQLAYGITVANLGKQTASSVTVTDTLPSGVGFVRVNAQQLVCNNGKCSNAASCSYANNTVSCSAASVTLLTPMLIEVDVNVQAGAGSRITNSASVSSANPEAAQGRTQSSATTVVTK